MENNVILDRSILFGIQVCKGVNSTKSTFPPNSNQVWKSSIIYSYREKVLMQPCIRFAVALKNHPDSSRIRDNDDQYHGFHFPNCALCSRFVSNRLRRQNQPIDHDPACLPNLIRRVHLCMSVPFKRQYHTFSADATLLLKMSKLNWIVKIGIENTRQASHKTLV